MTYSDLNNAINGSSIKRSPTPIVEQDWLYIFPIVGFIASVGGISYIHFICDKSRDRLVIKVSDLFKTYIKFKDQEAKIKELEDKLQGIFDKYI